MAMDDAYEQILRRHTSFTVITSGGQVRDLRHVVLEYTKAEAARHDEVEKFASAVLRSGRPVDAALGVNKYLGVPDQEIWRGMGEGVAAMDKEIRASGSAEDVQCLDYVLRGRAGEDGKRWPHSGNRQMDVFDDEADADGRHGKGLEHFVAHESSTKAGLLLEHVVALRLYTTAAYRIKKLRAVEGLCEGCNEQRSFWRGMRNLEIPEDFSANGGTEYAPLSTSSDFEVALMYSSKAEERLLFKILTDGFMERGADLQYLSAFPGEVEFLYPPLTFLKPTGRSEVVEAGAGVRYTVMEVRPQL